MLGVWAAPFAALLSAVLLIISLVFLRIRFARGACTPADPRMVLPDSDTREETEQRRTAMVPGKHQ